MTSYYYIIQLESNIYKETKRWLLVKLETNKSPWRDMLTDWLFSLTGIICSTKNQDILHIRDRSPIPETFVDIYS